jgi:hypothetical protein
MIAMMEWLNNANVIAGLIVAIFGIGGYIFAITTYLKGIATKSIKEDNSSSHKPSVRYTNKDDIVFDRIDWINAFAKGLFYFSMMDADNDNMMASIPIGCIFTPLFAAIASAVFAIFFYIIFSFLFNWSDASAGRGAFVVALICWITILLGIYIHFVGKAVETISNKKRNSVVHPPMYGKRTSYRRK